MTRKASRKLWGGPKIAWLEKHQESCDMVVLRKLQFSHNVIQVDGHLTDENYSNPAYSTNTNAKEHYLALAAFIATAIKLIPHSHNFSFLIFRRRFCLNFQVSLVLPVRKCLVCEMMTWPFTLPFAPHSPVSWRCLATSRPSRRRTGRSEVYRWNACGLLTHQF